MMFTLLDHLLNGAFIVFSIGFAAFLWDMAKYVFGGDHE
jgi:hypothetical protein